MLHVKKGKTKLKGYTGDLIVEFSLLTHSMTQMLEEKVGREGAIELLDNAYNTGKMTKEEALAKVKEILSKKVKEEKADE